MNEKELSAKEVLFLSKKQITEYSLFNDYESLFWVYEIVERCNLHT